MRCSFSFSIVMEDLSSVFVLSLSYIFLFDCTLLKSYESCRRADFVLFILPFFTCLPCLYTVVFLLSHRPVQIWDPVQISGITLRANVHFLLSSLQSILSAYV